MAQSSTESQLSEDIQLGVVMNTSETAYTIEKFLGEGTYGTVLQCSESSSTKKMAVKMVRKELSSCVSSEIAMLEKLNDLDETKHIVKYIENFTYENHICLVFEMLDISLFDLMENRSFESLALPEIRDIAQQMLVALDALKSIQVVHADIKPDNIMLVNHQSLPFEVKLIDFGLAVPTKGLQHGTVIQAPCFRAPEVILGIPMNEAVDMWSLGCVLAFLYLGVFLYPPLCEYETMRVINQVQGKPDQYLLNIGIHTKNNFKKKFPNGYWTLMTPIEHRFKTGCKLKPEDGVYNRFHSLDEVVYSRKEAKVGPQHRDSQAFISFLKGMLEIDPAKRITPSEALQHDFITMKHHCDITENNNNANLSHSTIKDCQQKHTMVEVISSEAVIQVRPSAADDTTTDKDDGPSATHLSCFSVDEESRKGAIVISDVLSATDAPDAPDPPDVADRTSATDAPGASAADRTTDKDDGPSATHLSCFSVDEESRKGAIVISVRPYPGAEEITADENDVPSATDAPATTAPDVADVLSATDAPDPPDVADVLSATDAPATTAPDVADVLSATDAPDPPDVADVLSATDAPATTAPDVADVLSATDAPATTAPDVADVLSATDAPDPPDVADVLSATDAPATTAPDVADVLSATDAPDASDAPDVADGTSARDALDTADIAVKADEPPASGQPNLDDISSDSEEGTTCFVEVKTRKKWFNRIGKFFSRMFNSVTSFCRVDVTG